MSKSGSFKNLDLGTNSPLALMKSKVLNMSAKKARQSFSAKKRSNVLSKEAEGGRSARLIPADKSKGTQKFLGKLPEKALRQTFKINPAPKRNATRDGLADLPPSENYTNEEGSTKLLVPSEIH